AGALDMQRQATEAVERQQKIERLLAAARTHAQAQDYEACASVTSDGLRLDSGNLEFKRLRAEAQQALAKRRKVQELMERARQQWGGKEYAGVLQTREGLLREEPGQGEALELKGQAGEALAREEKIKELLAAARVHAQAQ